MDADRFDALTQTFALRTRRRLFSMLAAVGLGMLAPAGDDALARCTKKCGPCKKCKNGTCKPKANGVLCRGGTCKGGKCVSAWTVQPPPVACSFAANVGKCCSVDADCPTGEYSLFNAVCVQGRCQCRDGYIHCGNNYCAKCCHHQDCPEPYVCGEVPGSDPANHCCLPAGQSCQLPDQCCSGSCERGVCTCSTATWGCKTDDHCCAGLSCLRDDHGFCSALTP